MVERLLLMAVEFSVKKRNSWTSSSSTFDAQDGSGRKACRTACFEPFLIIGFVIVGRMTVLDPAGRIGEHNRQNLQNPETALRALLSIGGTELTF